MLVGPDAVLAVSDVRVIGDDADDDRECYDVNTRTQMRNKKMAKQFAIEKVTEAKQRLQQLRSVPPESDKMVTRQAAVEMLSADILAMSADGYSARQIAEAISDGDFIVTGKSITQFLNKSAASGKRMTRKPRTRQKQVDSHARQSTATDQASDEVLRDESYTSD